MRLNMGKLVQAQVERGDDTVDAAPTEVAAFLAAHADDLDAVRAAAGGELAWESDFTHLWSAPEPDYLGHRLRRGFS